MTSKMDMGDWKTLADASDFYSGRGYEYVDVPWMVTHETSSITCPPGYEIKTDYGTLVGSAEQGFLELALKGVLKYNQLYQSITPCFRNETEDDTHQPYFMKLELFCLLDPSDNPHTILRNMINDAAICLDKSGESTKIVATGDYTYDIEVNDIEVGSYGIDTRKGITWVYGTGIALPRWRIANEG